jgi:prepilin-type N-terminal cleavage/methylation domain-containing protein
MPRARGGQDRRAGVTLIELVVVLTMLGIAAALALPAFQLADEPSSPEHARSRARLLALTRGETVALEQYADGRWSVFSDRDGESLADGQTDAPAAPLRLRITPLGTCFPAPGGGGSWDAVDCRALSEAP